ncbi:MAG: hypothetical protein KJ904_08005 [Alphaproteobacteria bacterium]|nr:hypothetical protein [Alphaproteobacteria bacterium]MBU0797746.1 hypothetical protein [Alphaproteobacteria bacterium]MBU0887093.1 hypothetical protein [Alphaproteobacteria bacterium]MBU1814343.1 hypothetical protein [Alphaproteobacteria bacterium]MBU2091105.1 hypothetical protein [Alphaproteobacteria bacterium]
MLIVATDIPAAQEEEFNRWYDREHVAERVGIPGFLSARRYIAVAASPKYISFYETETFSVLSSPAYKQMLANQTPWSKAVMAGFTNVKRQVARTTAGMGAGLGGAAAVIRLRPSNSDAAAAREALKAVLADLVTQDGTLAAHIMESDPELSKPLAEHKDAPKDAPEAKDWIVLVDTTAADVATAAAKAVSSAALPGLKAIDSGVYSLMWVLGKAEL